MTIHVADKDFERKVIGRGEASSISCKEAQGALSELAAKRVPIEDPDYEVMVLAHMFTCSTCMTHFLTEMEKADEDAKPKQ